MLNRPARGVRPYSCSQCDRSYFSRVSLVEHEASHRGVTHICDKCSKQFSTRKKLARHKRDFCQNRSSEDMKLLKFKCDTCGKKLCTAQNLQRHKETHKNSDGYICSSCGKRCSTKIGFKTHYRTCTQSGKYSCKFCKRKLATREHLYRHITWSHKSDLLTDKEYKSQAMFCSHCGQVFLAKSLLLTHENTHTGERKCKCDICGKLYKTHSNLSSHKRNVHIDQPNQYKCQVCGTATKSMRSFKRHLKLHDLNPEYSCKNCGKSYNRKDLLNTHTVNCRKNHMLNT